MTGKKWEYMVVAKAEFGGFTAELVDHGMYLFLSAPRFKGSQQPRVVLTRYPPPMGGVTDTDPLKPETWGNRDQGFRDWEPLLRPCSEEHSFEGDSVHAQNLIDQWIAKGRVGKVPNDPYSRRASGLPA